MEFAAISCSRFTGESEDGRYEVKATDKQGTRIELYVNPVTGEILKPEEERKERS
jgi:hypothetical protein